MKKNTKYITQMEKSFKKSYTNNCDFWSKDITSYIAMNNIGNIIKVKSNSKVLDIGSGHGLADIVLAPFCSIIDAIDICESECWNEISKYIGNLNFLKIDFLSFSNQYKYDMIIDNGCLHHQDPLDYDAYLNKVANILNDEGTYSLLVFKKEDPNSSNDPVVDQGRYCRQFALPDIESALNKHNLQIEKYVDISRGEKVSVFQVFARKTING